MRETFRGYYQPTDEEFSDLWEFSIFVFDANVLLNLYRYSPQTSGDLIKKLQKISDRIWIPHQAALEYQNNRLTVINQQESAYKEIKDLLIKSQKTIETGLERYTRHPFIDRKNIRKKINDIIVEVKEELDSSKLAHPNLIDNDELNEIITTLFEGKVGSPYSSDEIDKIHKLGSKRYSRKTPPGFKDESKDDMGKYGDLVLWFQIIAYAKLTEKPIIFITDDRKEDWWHILNGKTIGPHPQLIDEIFSESNMDFYMYQPDRFMEFHSKYFKEQVNKEALDEIQEIRKQDEEDEKTKEMTNAYRSIYKNLPDFTALVEQGLPSSGAMAVLKALNNEQGLSSAGLVLKALNNEQGLSSAGLAVLKGLNDEQGLPSSTGLAVLKALNNEQYKFLHQINPVIRFGNQKIAQLETEEEQNESTEQSDTESE